MLTYADTLLTAPDTLSCFPLKDEDPFVMEACPHVFFAGNQREYGASVMSGADGQRVLVVSVPSFATTNTAGNASYTSRLRPHTLVAYGRIH
jgi:DNA polymerase II small subunit/DNA polymerase delta subunit B